VSLPTLVSFRDMPPYLEAQSSVSDGSEEAPSQTTPNSPLSLPIATMVSALALLV